MSDRAIYVVLMNNFPAFWDEEENTFLHGIPATFFADRKTATRRMRRAIRDDCYRHREGAWLYQVVRAEPGR